MTKSFFPFKYFSQKVYISGLYSVIFLRISIRISNDTHDTTYEKKKWHQNNDLNICV